MYENFTTASYKKLNLFDLDTKLEFQRDQKNIFTEAGTILRTPPLVKN